MAARAFSDNKERVGFQKFKDTYKKPDFLADDYDHLKKDKSSE